MNKLYKIEDDIKPILEEDIKSRSDDMYLYKKYLELKGVIELLMFKVFDDKDFRKTNKIAPFESISRCRRKLQSQYEELRPNKELQARRDEQQMKFFEYATDYSSNFMKMVDSQKWEYS